MDSGRLPKVLYLFSMRAARGEIIVLYERFSCWTLEVFSIWACGSRKIRNLLFGCHNQHLNHSIITYISWIYGERIPLECIIARQIDHITRPQNSIFNIGTYFIENEKCFIIEYINIYGKSIFFQAQRLNRLDCCLTLNRNLFSMVFRSFLFGNRKPWNFKW